MAALQNVAGIDEGIFLSNIPSDMKMTQSVNKVVSTPSENVLTARIGDILSNEPLGFDDAGMPVYASSAKGGSHTTLRGRTIAGGKYSLNIEESVSATTAKYGSPVGKMFAKKQTMAETVATIELMRWDAEALGSQYRPRWSQHA